LPVIASTSGVAIGVGNPKRAQLDRSRPRNTTARLLNAYSYRYTRALHFLGDIDDQNEKPAILGAAMALTIYLLAFVGGFVIMSLELLGGRVMAPYFGSSIYVWGSIITIFMLSLSLGYLFGGKLSLHFPSLKRFGRIFLIAAVLLYPLVYFAEPVMNWIFEIVEDPRYGSLLAAAVLFILPTIILGMISPYSVRLLVQSTHESGQVAGRLYFVSTLGSAIGTLATSFYFVLWFEINTILTLLTAALVTMGIIAHIAHRATSQEPGQA